MKLRLTVDSTLQPLENDPTPKELEWWADARRPIRRKHVLQFTALISVPIMIGHVLERGVHSLISWSGFALICSQLAIGLGGGALNWLMQRNTQFRRALVARRLRQALTETEDANT